MGGADAEPGAARGRRGGRGGPGCGWPAGSGRTTLGHLPADTEVPRAGRDRRGRGRHRARRRPRWRGWSAYDDAQTVVAASLKLLPVDPVDAAGWLAGLHADIERLVADLSGLTRPEDDPGRRGAVRRRARPAARHREDAALPCLTRTRSFRLGVAGPVGTGKSSLIATVCRALAGELELGVVTNDIYTDEDARFLRSEGVLDADRIRAVETGACPHTAIRDDVTPNLIAVETLEADHAPLDVVLVESGGDNLTATFSPALVDAQIFVLDVAGGGDVARKGGPGIARADLLVVNKTDLAPYVGVDVARMVADAEAARAGRPVLALSRTDPESVAGWRTGCGRMAAEVRAGRHTPVDPGPMARHSHEPRPRPRALRWPRPATARRAARLTQGPLAVRRLSAADPDVVRVALVAAGALLLAGDEVRVEVRGRRPGDGRGGRDGRHRRLRHARRLGALGRRRSSSPAGHAWAGTASRSSSPAERRSTGPRPASSPPGRRWRCGRRWSSGGPARPAGRCGPGPGSTSTAYRRWSRTSTCRRRAAPAGRPCAGTGVSTRSPRSASGCPTARTPSRPRRRRPWPGRLSDEAHRSRMAGVWSVARAALVPRIPT